MKIGLAIGISKESHTQSQMIAWAKRNCQFKSIKNSMWHTQMGVGTQQLQPDLCEAEFRSGLFPGVVDVLGYFIS